MKNIPLFFTIPLFYCGSLVSAEIFAGPAAVISAGGSAAPLASPVNSFTSKDPIAVCQSLRNEAKLQAKSYGIMLNDSDLDNRVCTYGRFGNLNIGQSQWSLTSRSGPNNNVSAMANANDVVADNQIRWGAFIFKDGDGKEVIRLWIKSFGHGFSIPEKYVPSTISGTSVPGFLMVNMDWGFGRYTLGDQQGISTDRQGSISCRDETCPMTGDLRFANENTSTAMYPLSQQNAQTILTESAGWGVNIGSGFSGKSPVFQLAGSYYHTKGVVTKGTPRVINHTLVGNDNRRGQLDYAIDWNRVDYKTIKNSTLLDPVAPGLDLRYESGGSGRDSNIRGRNFLFNFLVNYTMFTNDGQVYKKVVGVPRKLRDNLTGVIAIPGGTSGSQVNSLCRQWSSSKKGVSGEYYMYSNPYLTGYNSPDEYVQIFKLESDSYGYFPTQATSGNNFSYQGQVYSDSQRLTGQPPSCRPYYNKIE
ncbi:hypothetical protein PWG14_24615 [Chromobacterium amazonense]|uniref:hypothetical protein n=1 Tax=Chromobacterium amazonense TaxID=1382803 RepID=UPI00237D8064|nr:hypothetical protein [Chromobacterium amazonense]MDE1715651.1 hypothetical protein [Chromobacterium amazonense]